MKQEAGNFYPDTPDAEPLSTLEAVVIYGGLVVASVISAALIVIAAGWAYQTFFN